MLRLLCCIFNKDFLYFNVFFRLGGLWGCVDKMFRRVIVVNNLVEFNLFIFSIFMFKKLLFV